MLKVTERGWWNAATKVIPPGAALAAAFITMATMAISDAPGTFAAADLVAVATAGLLYTASEAGPELRHGTERYRASLHLVAPTAVALAYGPAFALVSFLIVRTCTAMIAASGAPTRGWRAAKFLTNLASGAIPACSVVTASAASLNQNLGPIPSVVVVVATACLTAPIGEAYMNWVIRRATGAKPRTGLATLGVIVTAAVIGGSIGLAGRLGVPVLVASVPALLLALEVTRHSRTSDDFRQLSVAIGLLSDQQTLTGGLSATTEAIADAVRTAVGSTDATIGDTPPDDGSIGVELADGRWLVASGALSTGGFSVHEQTRLDALAGPVLSALLLASSYEAADRRAMTDPLTGLHNRAGMAAAASDNASAVLLIDLDGFKAVNDTHGHAAGDTVLVETAHRLVNQTRSDDLVVRVGGDEFVVILSDLAGPVDAFRVAERIEAALCRPVPHDGTMLEVGASVGVTIIEQDGVEAALARADEAMYARKEERRGRRRNDRVS